MDQQPPILICTDLDRTLIPNGAQRESARARPLFHALAARRDVHLAYVSGRDLGLVQRAMAEWDLPQPEYVIGDVGTSIYTRFGDDWELWSAWQEAIGPDWQGLTHDQLAVWFADLPPLRLQEPQRQKRYKLSYYSAADVDSRGLLDTMRDRLRANGLRASLTWSVDETTATGLIDVLPASASKHAAVEFLIERRHYQPARCLFAGDSGNDLAVLASPVQAVLVANATAEVRAEAWEQTQAAGTQDQLYFARGEVFGLNGCYSAGILEGAAHFIPEIRQWLEQETTA